MARQFHPPVFQNPQDRAAQFPQNIIGLSEARLDDASTKFRDLRASVRYLVRCIGFDETDTGVPTVQRKESKLMGTINVEERLSSYENATHDFVTKLDPLVHDLPLQWTEYVKEAGVRAAAKTKEIDTQEQEKGGKAHYSSLAVLAAHQAAISNSERLTTLVEDVVHQCKELLAIIDKACPVDKYMSAGITTTPQCALILDVHLLLSNFCGEALSVYIDTNQSSGFANYLDQTAWRTIARNPRNAKVFGEVWFARDGQCVADAKYGCSEVMEELLRAAGFEKEA
ncbi:hypothetical protein DFS34DRAFT_691124 [Phlyctochytrium arcticum]|nr:hypothetical protein DFS34DRAFT_691124 [Phlyctochytrium arcticum]